MYGFKYFPLNHIQNVLDRTPADLGSDPDHTLQQRRQLPGQRQSLPPHSSREGLSPNHIYLKAVAAASSKNLKHSALTEHIREASFHGLFNPSSLHSCEFVFGKPQNTQRSGFSLIKRPQKSRQSSKPSEPSECGKVK